MAFAQYRAALANIAANEANGENVHKDVAFLAMRTGMAYANVRQDVTETADLLG